MADQPIILFDGICNFCNFWVQFAIKRDKKGTFKFATLQGKTAAKILPTYGLSTGTTDSVILIEDGKAYTKSSAVLRIFKRLNGPIKLLYAYIIVPKFIRDAVYGIVARNRYRWFGKKESCMIPSAEQRGRFLD